jgi:hypothetical protein
MQPLQACFQNCLTLVHCETLLVGSPNQENRRPIYSSRSASQGSLRSMLERWRGLSLLRKRCVRAADDAHFKTTTWSRHSRRIDPFRPSTNGIGQGDRDAITTSSTPTPLNRVRKAAAKNASRSHGRYRGAERHPQSGGKARLVLGLAVTPNDFSALVNGQARSVYTRECLVLC